LCTNLPGITAFRDRHARQSEKSLRATEKTTFSAFIGLHIDDMRKLASRRDKANKIPEKLKRYLGRVA
jgi:hypothetical protein